MTEPALDTDEQLSGRAADALADIHDELRRRSSDLNAAEAQLAEALLTAQATSVEGRRRLQDIQRQLIEAINNPVNALDTPAGERQFLMFLRDKVSEIQGVVDNGALTSEDQAALARTLASGYLSDAPQALTSPFEPAVAPRAEQSASAAPAPSSASMPALGGLPQAAAGPAQSMPAGLGSSASPLAGLPSLLAGDESSTEAEPDRASEPPERGKVTVDDDEDTEDDARDSADDDDSPAGPDDAPSEDAGPAETRPAAS